MRRSRSSRKWVQTQSLRSGLAKWETEKDLGFGKKRFGIVSVVKMPENKYSTTLKVYDVKQIGLDKKDYGLTKVYRDLGYYDKTKPTALRKAKEFKKVYGKYIESVS